MKTDDRQAPFWMLEDVQLRCQIAAQSFTDAFATGQKILGEISDEKQKAYFEATQKDVGTFRRMSLNYAFHIRETNVAEMLRTNIQSGRPLDPKLVEEMKHLLEADADNELPCVNCRGGRALAQEMNRLFQKDPAAFLQRYLVPANSGPQADGPFAFTTR
jgi:hypothetical protein